MNRWCLLIIFVSGCSRTLQPSGISHPLDTPLEKIQISKTCSFEDQQREQILALANPENYLNTRYRKRPKAFPKETDCSHFVHQVYSRVGLPYRYRSSKDFAQAEEFEPISPRLAQPGDIVVFKNHMGILSKNYQVISATRQRPSIQELDAHFFRLDKKSSVYRYRCREQFLGEAP